MEDTDYTVRVEYGEYTVKDHNMGICGETPVRRESRSSAVKYLDTCVGETQTVRIEKRGEETLIVTGGVSFDGVL